MRFFPLRSRPDDRPFRFAPLAAAALAALLLGGCGTTIEEAVPGARHSGDYPNLNLPVTAATRQFTDAEAKASTSQLAAARDAQAATADKPPPTKAGQLRKLGSTHASEALEEIER